MVTIEDLVPENHFLRELERALDLSFVHEETAHLYSRRYGRPPIDPVVIVKYLFVGFLYGIPSERQIEQRCADSNAFRWYLGIGPSGKRLRPKQLYRSGSGLFWEYWADKKDCVCCPLRDKCLSETDRTGARKLQDSYFKPSVQRHFARRWEPKYLETLNKRQIWCKGPFAAQKWGHNLTRLLRRGLEAAEDHCILSATTLNLKRMIRCMV